MASASTERFQQRPGGTARRGWRDGTRRPASSLLFLLLLFLAPVVSGQEMAEPLVRSDTVAEVRLDGRVLFRVRGASSYPARERARAVSGRIRELAQDETVPPEAVVFEARDDYFLVRAGERELLRLVEEDAALESVKLPLLAEIVAARIREAVGKYREARTSQALGRSALYSIGLTLALVFLVWALGRLRSILGKRLRRRVNSSMAALERKSASVLHRSQLWRLAEGLLQVLYWVILLLIGYFWLSSVLGTFPWTRGFALALLDYIERPLLAMGNALVGSIPDLMFLVVLWFVVRFLLKTLKSLFAAVGRGRLRLANFEPEWADPTYRLVRIGVIAFAIVVAYPYIPGSDSAAFKGISLFLGVIVSLGSTSFISNLIAGVTLTYRGVFREGDWVEVDGTEGQVEEIRAQVVRLRTRDNERVSIPSSTILNVNVVNLSEQADRQGLVLRCPVGLGYDVAWRQAERLLLQAAKDVDGVLSEPAPFVQVNELGDFAVTHTLVVRIPDAGPLPAIRTALNQAILDRFHGAGVQIMSPAYVQDPPEPKIPAPPDA